MERRDFGEIVVIRRDAMNVLHRRAEVCSPASRPNGRSMIDRHESLRLIISLPACRRLGRLSEAIDHATASSTARSCWLRGADVPQHSST